jgi:hypothetical protein
MLKWLRRQVNGDLRYWRHAGLYLENRRGQLIAGFKAQLSLLDSADHWRAACWDDQPSIKVEMESDRLLYMAVVRRAFAGYRGRPGWRDEWDYRSR